MPVAFRNLIKRLALKANIELNYHNPAQSKEARFSRQLAQHGINLILDVGANDGGYGSYLRSIGYRDAIISFEPLTIAHTKLSSRARTDPFWHVMPRMALGSTDDTSVISVAGNSASSSMLPMLEVHRHAAPSSAYVGTEPVVVRKLAGLDIPLIREYSNILLKIDAQGYEMQVLEGAEALLARVHGIQVELSLTPLYDGQSDYRSIIDWLTSRGYRMWNVIPGFVDQETGRMLQFDGIFFRDITEP
jgi:FkbM family methyltransferase